MASKRYFVILNMETHIRKTDLALGVIDTDHSIRNSVMRELDDRFPNSIYDKMETLDSIIYSIKKSLPAKPFMDLRTMALIFLNIEQDFYQQKKDEELESALKNANVDVIVGESQHCFYLNNVFYDCFRWKSYNTSLPINIDDRMYTSYLDVTQSGIQIYSSAPDFDAEIEGELGIMLNPLKHILKSSHNQFIDTLSIQIESIHRQYGKNIF